MLSFVDPPNWTLFGRLLYFGPFGVLSPEIFTRPTTPNIVLLVGLGAPGGLKLGSDAYF